MKPVTALATVAGVGVLVGFVAWLALKASAPSQGAGFIKAGPITITPTPTIPIVIGP